MLYKALKHNVKSFVKIHFSKKKMKRRKCKDVGVS